MLKYKFCPHCGSEITQKGGVINCSSCGKVTYLHSSATGSIFVVKNGKVLLARRAEEPFKNYWDVLGGFLHFGEHPKEGALRELREETGMKIKIIALLGVYMDKYNFQGAVLPTLNTVFIGETVSGKASPSDDVSELRWFDINKPIKKVAFKMVAKGLKDLRKWYKK